MKTASERFWRATLYSLLGPLVWTLHFGVIYGGQHVACSAPVSLNLIWITAGIGAATLIAAIPLLAGALAPRMMAKTLGLSQTHTPVRRFLTGSMRVLCVLSLFGVLWAGAAVIFLTACPALR